MANSARAEAPPSGAGLTALEAVSAAVEAGAGLPEVVRAAERALNASLAVSDGSGRQLAVAARSSADERALAAEADGVETLELRVAEELVGRVRMRLRGDSPPPVVLAVIRQLLTAEVERVRAPERASEEAMADLVHALLGEPGPDGAERGARARSLGVDLQAGGTVGVAAAPAPRRCWPPTSSRPTPAPSACWPSRTPAPTGSCSRT